MTIKPFILKFVSIVLVLSILFVFPLNAFATVNGAVNMMIPGYDKAGFIEDGWVSSESSQFYVFMPIMSDGIKYNRVNPNTTHDSDSGRYTWSNWGTGTYNSSKKFYTYSKRLFFADTTRRYTNNYNFDQTLFVIPKNTSVRITFVLHLTGSVQYYRDVYELISISPYTSQSYEMSDKFVSFITDVSTSYYWGLSGIGEGTDCSRWTISETITAGSTDVYINSFHLNMNAIDWDSSILPLSSCGRMFQSFLIVDFLEEKNDPADRQGLLGFFDDVGDWFSGLGTSIGGFFTDLWDDMSTAFTSLGSKVTSLGTKIGGFFDDLWNDMSTAFTSLGSKVTSLGTKIGGFFDDLWDDMSSAFTSLGTKVTSLGTKIGGFFDDLWNDISSAFSSLGTTIGGFFTDLWNDHLKGGFNTLSTILSNLGTNIGGFFTDLWNDMSSAFTSLGNTIGTFFSNLWTNMSTAFSSLGTTIGGFFTDLWNDMSAGFQEIVSALTGIPSWFSDIGDIIMLGINSFVNIISSIFSLKSEATLLNNGNIFSQYS